jgi:glycosyltransferase involved in cell wall biosynthesis
MTVNELMQETELKPIRLRPLAQRPLVSILVANYNYEKYIGQAIESILAQTYQHFEVIICDDGSDDNSVCIVESYAKRDPRIRLIRKANGGHGSALNTAYAESRGQIICLLDSDDLFAPNKVQKVVECCQTHGDAGFAVHRVIRINENGRRQGVWPMSGALPEGWCGPSMLVTGGILPYLPPTSGISLRRELADALFPMSTEKPLGLCPDQVMMRVAPLLSPVAKIDAPLAEYRLHQSNSYGSSRITVAFLTREIGICRSLWQAQKEYLTQQSPELAAQLRPVESSPYLLYIRYLLARFSGDPLASERHSEYMASLRAQPDARYVWFWNWSIHLPVFMFDYAVNLMCRQSMLKQIMARLKGLV